MKYLTPEHYVHLQRVGSDDMDKADAAWEQAVERYEEHLQRLRPELPEPVRRLLDDFYLHDADVVSMARQGDTFVLVLRLETPPGNLLILTYELMEPPNIATEVLPADCYSPHVQWLFDEIDRSDGERSTFRHTILFSNGWQVCLTFRTVQLLAAQTILPTSPVPQPAPQPI